jgi:predicted metal-dependent peptidase
MGRGIVLPSTQKDGVSKAAFLIDTSGSCDEIALACVRDEAQAMMDDGIVDEIVVVYGDTRVTRVDEFRTGDELEFDPRGGGGTDMEPLFSFVAEEHEDAALIVCFTDLDFYKSCGDEPHCPVLFAVHGYPQFVKAKIAAGAPWGAKAIDVGAH